MAKITSKLQVTVPKAIADRYRLEPGDEIEWEPAEDVIHVIPPGRSKPAVDPRIRLKLFDAASERQRQREKRRKYPKAPADRGWTREDLYQRGRSR